MATSLSSASGCSTCGGCSQRAKVTKAPNLLRVEIHHPVLEDEGVYLCEASNALGNASASATFNAQGEWVQGMSGLGAGAPAPASPGLGRGPSGENSPVQQWEAKLLPVTEEGTPGTPLPPPH